MLTKITGRHMEVTEALRSYVDKKVPRLSKCNRIAEIEVVFSNEAMVHKVEVIIKADHHQRFVVSQTAEDAYASFGSAIDKMERQLIRHKEKSRNRKGRTGAAEATAEVIEAQEVAEEDNSK